MTEQQAREKLEQLLVLVLRCRSIFIESLFKRSGQESLDHIDEIVLEHLDHVLFGRKWNLLGDLLRVLAKPAIAPIDYDNMLVRASQSDALLLYGGIVDLPIPLPDIHRW